MSNNLAKMICTFFYLGYFPLMPGSMASLAGVGIYFLAYQNALLYMAILIVITVLGFLCCGKMEKVLKKKDPSCVVIDEVSGMLIALFMLPATPAVIITAFFLFRAFDMFKIYPSNKLEALHGSAGIMLDDIMAGVYTNITLRLAIIFLGTR